MLNKDIYGKTLSTTFTTAISAHAQYVKPKVLMQFMDSRHVEKKANQTTDPFASTNDPHASSIRGSIGHYFSPAQAMNGVERQSFTWAVCDALDKNGDVIKADGNWYSMPPEDTDNYEFGWWSGTKSTSTYSATYGGYVFTTSPYVEFQFIQRKVNKVRIITSEYYGQIAHYTLYLYNENLNLVLEENGVIDDEDYYNDHYLPNDLDSNEIYKIKIVVNATKNPLDHARINEVCPYYEIDISDYVIDHSIERIRDVHPTSLPIGGGGSARVSLSLDNSEKLFNIFNSSSTYGPYMKKDIRFTISNGWRIKNNPEPVSTTELLEDLAINGTTIYVKDGDIFPDGGAGNHYIISINNDYTNREYILVSSKAGTRELTVEQRGYFNTDAAFHEKNSTVYFDMFEYVPAGTFYVDEWSGSSSSMTISVTASDWSKFLSEKNITKGFLVSNSTMDNAVLNLLMQGNFPKSDFKNINPYVSDSHLKRAKSVYSFSEPTIDRSGNNIILSNGLRLRLWGMPSGSESYVREILADEIEKTLTQEDLADLKTAYTSPNKTDISTAYSTNATYAVDYDNFSFVGNNGTTYTQYFNGVIDGYYIPLQSGNQDIKVKVLYGGIRVYLNDALIIDGWNNVSTLTTYTSQTIVGGYLNLTAGTPYKIRIEFFHQAGASTMDLYLFKQMQAGAEEKIPASSCRTIVARDSYGSRNAGFDITGTDFNLHENNGIYLGNVELSKAGGIVSDSKNNSVYLNGGYIRIPNHSSISIDNNDFTYEAHLKFNNGGFSNDGDYICSLANTSPSDGFTFFYLSSNGANGFKVVTSSGTEQVVASTPGTLLSNAFTHLAVTFNSTSKSLKYYINGSLAGSSTLTGNVVTQTKDITIGGKGSSFTSGSGENAPSTSVSFYIDEFAIYKQELSADQIKNRYISSRIQPITTYPYIYGNDETIKNIIDDISLADLGRFYIDEQDYGRYEHFYRFFEDSIDQHANVQYTISDSTNIMDSDYVIQLQANKIVVKVAGISTSLSGTQTLWRADSPTTLAVVTLNGNITSTETSMFASSTTDPVFPNSGYLIIDSEIIKYSAKTDNSFTSLERGQFGTTAASHSNGTKIREVKVYDISYDKAPAFNIKYPLITAIDDEEPNKVTVLRFETTPYTSQLILAASTNVDAGDLVFLEGKNPITNLDYFTAVAGIPVVTTEQKSQIKEQSSSLQDNIRKYGLKEVTIDSPYITDPVHAKKIADFIISKMSDPVPLLNINIMAIPTIQLGDRIRISAFGQFDIINNDYWVIGYQMAYGSSINQFLTLRKVV